jgi:hypothetical protein
MTKETQAAANLPTEPRGNAEETTGGGSPVPPGRLPLVSELIEVVKAFVQQEVEYMTINHLGDPEKQHNVKWARAVLAKAGAKQP